MDTKTQINLPKDYEVVAARKPCGPGLTLLLVWRAGFDGS
jgi:hypothetical protein